VNSMMRQTTFCITWHLRELDLQECVASIKQRYPSAEILTQDTGGNLSYGRNRLLDRCATRYYFMLEEDMRITPRTDLGLMWRILQHHNVQGVSGVLEERRGSVAMAAMIRRTRGGWNWSSSRDLFFTERGEPWIYAHATKNWGLFEWEALNRVRWDERLDLHEHFEFFVRWYRAGKHVGVCRSSVAHYKSRPSGEYIQQRRRARKVFFAKSDSIMGRNHMPRNWTAFTQLSEAKWDASKIMG